MYGIRAYRQSFKGWDGNFGCEAESKNDTEELWLTNFSFKL